MTTEYPQDVQRIIDDVNAKHEAKSGFERLSSWFGLSYASFLVLPRIMMQAMPDDWQKRMAILLEEYEGAYPNHPPSECIVTRKEGNKFAKWPEWMLRYRRPDPVEIEKARTR